MPGKTNLSITLVPHSWIQGWTGSTRLGISKIFCHPFPDCWTLKSAVLMSLLVLDFKRLWVHDTF